MGLGGVILAGVGIIMVVLVANNRWAATWNAMLGSGSSAPSSNGYSLPIQPAQSLSPNDWGQPNTPATLLGPPGE
jgi:hypothetical protein